MEITSLQNSKIKELAKLKTVKHRKLNNLYLVEGEHLVKEAHKLGILKELIILNDLNLKLDVPTIYVTKPILKHLSDLSTPPGIIGVCKIKEIDNFGHKILCLDNISDPGNLGTLIRSALAFNFDTLIISNDSVDLYNPKVLRATQGTHFHLNIITGNLDQLLPKIKAQNIPIYGTAVNNGINLKDIKPSNEICIILGNEGSGIKPEILSFCDNLINININPNCESLNVGVAGSIIMYELSKKV